MLAFLKHLCTVSYFITNYLNDRCTSTDSTSKSSVKIFSKLLLLRGTKIIQK